PSSKISRRRSRGSIWNARSLGTSTVCGSSPSSSRSSVTRSIAAKDRNVPRSKRHSSRSGGASSSWPRVAATTPSTAATGCPDRPPTRAGSLGPDARTSTETVGFRPEGGASAERSGVFAHPASTSPPQKRLAPRVPLPLLLAICIQRGADGRPLPRVFWASATRLSRGALSSRRPAPPPRARFSSRIARLRRDPGGEGLVAPTHRELHHAGAPAGVALCDAPQHGLDELRPRLEEQHELVVLFELPLPAVDAGHRPEDVAAGHELLLHELAGELEALFARRHGRVKEAELCGHAPRKPRLRT